LLVPAGEVSALGQALAAMLTDRDAREEWQRSAKEGIARFRVNRMAHDVRGVYEELLANECGQVASDVAVLK
jgi:hypothetical protein